MNTECPCLKSSFECEYCEYTKKEECIYVPKMNDEQVNKLIEIYRL